MPDVSWRDVTVGVAVPGLPRVVLAEGSSFGPIDGVCRTAAVLARAPAVGVGGAGPMLAGPAGGVWLGVPELVRVGAPRTRASSASGRDAT